MRRHQLMALVAVVLVACVDGGRSNGPSFAISDAAHGGGTAGFYFLPPMVPKPTISEQFNAFLQPEVTICKWVNDACASTLVNFTRTSGAGSEIVRVSTVDKQYIVNWHTDEFNVQPGEQYRIQVFADPDGQFRLGFADIAIAATGKAAKNLTTLETIGLVDGRTLPIKFFAGLGALGQCDPSGPTCAEAIVPPAGGLVVAVNADGEAEAFADFPSDWTDEPVTVTLERLPNTPGPLGAPEGLHQWPLFYEFQAFVSDGEGGLVPAGQFARRVRIGVCNIDNPFGDPDHPDDRGSVSLGIGAGNNFRTLPLVDATDILGLCQGITLAVRSGVDASGWRAFFARAVAVATQVVLPRPLYASTAVVVDGGMGGSTDSFSSPVGTVKGRPDLVVHDISIFPPSPQPGDAITITAEIRNVGSIHAGRTLVTIDVSGQAPFQRELSCPNLDEGEVPWTASLAPFENSEESCFVSRTVSFEAAGDFTVTARADAVGDLATESNEENNTRVTTLTVANQRADLIIESLTHAPASPTDADLIDFGVTVKNVGSAPAGQFTIVVTTNGENVSLNGLDPGQSALNPGQSVTRCCWRSHRSAGSYTQTATADYNKVIAETNETNNTLDDRYAVTAVVYTGRVTDPTGDVPEGEADLISGTATVAGGNLTLHVDFAPGTMASTSRASFNLDVDRNPATGFPGIRSGGGVDAEFLGVEYVIQMGSAFVGPTLRIVHYDGTSFVTIPNSIAISFSTDAMEATIPLDLLLGNRDGTLNYKVSLQRQVSDVGFSGVFDDMTDVGLPPGTVLPPIP